MNIIMISVILILIACLTLVYMFYRQTSNNSNENLLDIQQKKETFKGNNINTPKNLIMNISYNNNNFSLELELFDKVVPKTTKNFRTISLKGINGKTYNGNKFHRIIKGFMLQGGDIVNGDGTGSISIYGNNFNDENFKYRHDSAGLLSMANSGPNTNGSQFFITTVPTPHLDGKHVVFGKVVKGMEHLKYLESIPTDTNDMPNKFVNIVSINKKL
jgi:cyclophilin family peptidyl-prolyl cis-trans isomerase